MDRALFLGVSFVMLYCAPVPFALQDIQETPTSNKTSHLSGDSNKTQSQPAKPNPSVPSATKTKENASFEGVIEQDDDELRLVKALFSTGYNKEVRPVKNKSEAIEVIFGIAYTQLVELDEKNQVLISNVWIRQKWHNHLLTWNASHYGGIASINVSPKIVWLPDIILYNNAEEGILSGNMDQFKTKVILYSNGLNVWYAPTILRSRCSIDITYFPFDDQRCELKFGSWTYDGLRVNLQNMSATVDLKAYMPSGEFEMVEAPVERVVFRYSCCPEPYPNILFTLHIRRKVLFYFNNLIVPCFLITAFALLTFVLPPNTGERVTLVITTLLAMTVFMLMIAENTPTTSDVTPLIGKFFVASMVEIGLALIATCFVLNIYEHTGPTSNVPRWIRFALIEVLGPVLLVMKPREKPKRKWNQMSNNSSSSTPLANMFAESNGNATEIDSNPKEVLVLAPKVGDKVLSSRDFITSVNNENNLRYRGAQNTNAQERLLDGITILADRAKEKEKQEELKEEWESVAKVVDRMFLVIFIATVAISTTMIFLQRPSYATM